MRPYLPGDDLKHLDWKHYARTDRLFTRVYRETTEWPVMLAVDTSRSMAFADGRGVTKLQVGTLLAAALTYLLVQQGEAVGLVTHGADTGDSAAGPHGPAASGPDARRLLSRVSADGGTDLAGAIRRAAARLGRRGCVALISDLYGADDLQPALREARRMGHEVVVFHVLTPEERDAASRRRRRVRRSRDRRAARGEHAADARGVRRARRGVHRRGSGRSPRPRASRSSTPAPNAPIDAVLRAFTQQRAPAGRRAAVIWAAPWAWALALAAVLPVIAHLWSRKRPRALAFPDAALPARRLAGVAATAAACRTGRCCSCASPSSLAICAAAAGPTLTSAWRQRAWHDRLHRVIVVDDSVAASAAEVIAEEQRGAASSVVLGDDTIAGLLDDAATNGARAARSTRTELVLVWDGATSTLTRADLDAIPVGVGLRLRTLPPIAASADAGAASIAIEAAPADAAASQRVQAAGRTLRLPGVATPLLVRWPASRSALQQGEPAAMRTPASAGVVPGPIRRALDDVASDVRVRDAADRSRADDRAREPSADRDAGVALARSDDLSPLLRGGFEAPRHLVIALDAAPMSPLAWWSIVSARESLARIDRLTAPSRWTNDDIVAAQRPAPMPTGTMPGGLDTRAAWALVLVLLLGESAWRRRSRTTETPGANAREATDAA